MTVTRTPRLGLVRWDADTDPWSREDLVETLDRLEEHVADRDLLPLNAKDAPYNAAGDGVTDDTAALQAVIDDGAATGRQVLIPAGTYRTTATIVLPANGCNITGSSEKDNTGTIISYQAAGSAPAFTNNSDLGLSFLRLENLKIVQAGITPGTVGAVDCFALYGLTNNSRVANVYVANFTRHAFSIKAKTNSTDPTAAGNVTFTQVFVISCGGYAWEVDGYPNAVWNMCDVNSCVAGAFHFLNGVSNQAHATIIGLWWEGSRTWSSLNPILLDSGNGLAVNLIGCNFQGYTNSTDVVRLAGVGVTGGITFVGCTSYNFANAINDTINTKSIAASGRINYTSGTASANAFSATGPTSFIEQYDTAAPTANRRRYRWALSGDIYVLSQRNDDGTSVRDILYVQAGSNGRVDVVNALKVNGSVGFYGTTPVAKPGATAELKGALASLGLITAGGATPLDLEGGALTCGLVTATGLTATDGTLEVTGNLAVTGDVTIAGASVATDADLNAHVTDATDAHAATAIGFTPTGGIAATTVAAALAELDTEKAPKAAPTFTGTLTTVGLTASGNVSLGDTAMDLIGFYGVPGVARSAAYNLTGSPDRTLGAYASDPESAAYAGVPADLANAATRAELNQLRAAYENLRTYVEDLAGVTIATATDLKALGLLG